MLWEFTLATAEDRQQSVATGDIAAMWRWRRPIQVGGPGGGLRDQVRCLAGRFTRWLQALLHDTAAAAAAAVVWSSDVFCDSLTDWIKLLRAMLTCPSRVISFEPNVRISCREQYLISAHHYYRLIRRMLPAVAYSKQSTNMRRSLLRFIIWEVLITAAPSLNFIAL